MIYKDMEVPSENMIKPMHEILRMTRKQEQELYQKEEDKLYAEQAQADRAYQSHAEYVKDYINDYTAGINNRARFLEGVKNGLLNLAIMHLYQESFSHPMNERDKIVAKNLVSRFINEQGIGNLLTRFKYTNTILAEMGRIVTETYNKVIDDIDSKKDPNNAKPIELNLDKTIVDDFYKDIIDLDTTEASSLIKDKVADAMSDFIDQNVQNRIEFQDVINQAKEKIQDTADEVTAEAYMNEAKRQVNELRRTRPKNIFHYMVEAITKQAYKDENLNKRYVHESVMDMDGVVNSAELIYTFLEMVNTTEMVSQDYIKDYIKSLVEI